MMEYYDKEGRPLDRESGWRLFEDMDYKRVASTDVGPYWVSTVWLGLDHRFIGDGPPVIFETMVFAKGQRDDPQDHGLTDIDCVRYCTEAEAKAGHEAMVLLVKATLQEEIDGTELREGPEDGPVDEEGGSSDPQGDPAVPEGPARRGGPEVQQRRKGDGHRDPG